MAQGRNKLFDMEDREKNLLRKRKSEDKLNAMMTELEKYVVDDVANLAPKERVSLYAKLLKFVLPPAQAEDGKVAAADAKVNEEERFSIFSNVLSAAKGDGMVN